MSGASTKYEDMVKVYEFNREAHRQAFEDLGGTGMSIGTEVRRTAAGVPYLTAPGVALVGASNFFPAGMQNFLDGFDEELGFARYLEDPWQDGEGTGAAMIKTAGQLCYMSFGEKRSKNADASKYLHNIKASGHGSVLEHVQLNFITWGESRSYTHELVRHRAGAGFSQVSQRYVDGKVLRFVERPEYQNDDALHKRFERRVEAAVQEYDWVAEQLKRTMAAELETMPATERRKRVNQAARSVLPNETEAPVFVSLNARALRHVCEMRASGPAEVEIRNAMFRLFLCAARVEPLLMEDYEIVTLPDGTKAVNTPFRKV